MHVDKLDGPYADPVNDPSAVRYEKCEAVGVVTLNRPNAGNAFTADMHREYRRRLQDAIDDVAVGAIVVTGAGGAFCSGADIAAVSAVARTGTYPGKDRSSAESRRPRPGYGVHEAFDRAFLYHFGIPKPVIAAINGPSAGLGFVLACCADVRFASMGATLSPAFVRLGLPAEFGVSWLLTRLIGTSRAAEILLSGRAILAKEAMEIGLVHRVCTRSELLDHAVAYAADMVANCPPVALRETKRQVYIDLLRELGPAFDASMEITRQLVAGSEFAEGVARLRARIGERESADA